MSILAGLAKFIGDRLVSQNTNKMLERLGLDKVLVRLLPSKTLKPLQHAIVVAGDGNRPPEFRARFAVNGKDGIFYLEQSMAVGGIGTSGMWTLPRKIEVARQDRFAPGITIDFPIFGRFEHDREGTMYFFGSRLDLVEGYPRDSLNPLSHYQGRITFQSDGGAEQHCYFIVATGNQGVVPTVTGEHMFSHVWEWEGKVPPNTNPRALFK